MRTLRWFGDYEGADAPLFGRLIRRGYDDSCLCLIAVGDPSLGAREAVPASCCLNSRCRRGACVTTIT